MKCRTRNNHALNVTHMSWAKTYKYKSICFDWHDYLGPTFLRVKDLESKPDQFRPRRDYGLLSQWLNLSKEDRELYRI